MNEISKMTREEVIKILQELTYKHANLTYIKALDMAIEMLSAETVSREVYEKRIQADEQIIDSYRRKFSKAVLAKVVQGKWIHDGQNFKGGLDWCHCSECGYKTSANGLSMYNFCPNCGARMKAR